VLCFDAEHMRDAALRRRDRATSTSASLCVSAPPLRSRARSQRGPGAVLAAAAGVPPNRRTRRARPRSLRRCLPRCLRSVCIRCGVCVVVYGAERVCVLTLQMLTVLRQLRPPGLLAKLGKRGGWERGKGK
jgi:hypothetical protein